ncbi:MAG: hypothetical protein Q4G39_00970 [Brachymonas sp.]|nr:hypothetical protein [Brachymonas sp.]
MKIVVEAYFVHILPDRVRWYCQSMEVGAGGSDIQTPDQAVHALVHGCSKDKDACLQRYLAHSTSWRFEAPDVLVLSYIVCPETQDDDHERQAWQETFLHELQLAHSHHPADTHPPMIEQHHVLSHALRHLAFLTQGSTADAVISSHFPEPARRFLSHVIPALAGQLMYFSERCENI